MPLLNGPSHSKAKHGDRSFSFASSARNFDPNAVMCAPTLSSSKSRMKKYLFHSVCKDRAFSLFSVHAYIVWPYHCLVDDLSYKMHCFYIKKKSKINSS